jgi:hypothetical protein
MSLFNSEQFGKDPRFWLGQIVDDSEWKENRPEGLYDTSDEVPGWGYRYKVRIFGKHPETGLQDVELPWADILYPVTSGSGHASSFQTPNLRKGNFVFGIYLDGKDETQPCIFGCFGNNDQTNLLFTRPPVGFTPTSGLYGEEVPVYSIPAGGSGPKGGPSPHEGTGLGDNQNNEGNGQELEDGRQESTLPVSEKCAKSLDDTQIELKKFIQRVEETQRRAQNWSYWVNTKGTELASGVFRTETIEIDIQKTAQRISERIKDIINGIRQYITEKIDDIISDTYKLFFPEEEKEVEEAHNQAIDLITCLFNKIIANLIKMIGDLLRELVGRFINVPLCAVENILSGLLGQLLGLITGTLNSIFGPLSALIGSAIDLAGDILGFVSQILGFFLCDEDSACPENTKWSSWGGASGSKTSLDFNKIFNKTKEISENAKKIVDPNNFDFNLDFSSVFQDTCNVGPILCGPPTVDFTGGGGRGARGNAIVNLAGNILGVDIITPGSGYTRSPTVTFVDACGKGKGAAAEVEMEDDENNPGKKKVKRVKIKSPGSGYLPGFDGSRGGDGRVYATPDQIVIKRNTGKFEVFNPDDSFEVFEGDEVSGPFVTTLPGGVSGPGFPGGPGGLGGVGGGPGFPGGPGGLGGVGGGFGDDLEDQLIAGGTGGEEINVGGDSAVAGDLVVTIGGSGGTQVVSGGFGGTPVTIGDIPLIAGGVGGTTIPNVTSGGLPVTIGGIGGLRVTSGGTGGTPVIITRDTPTIADSTSFGSYPVVLELSAVEIESTGVNYSPNDTISIIPSNGAVLEPVFGPFGSIIDINIIDNGEGFTEIPEIVVNTESGYNANLIPILGATRIGDVPEELYKIPQGEKIIKVVDCVGKP